MEKTYQRKEDEGVNLDGKEASKKNSFLSGEGGREEQWGCYKTPL
jgi:hypothetical protein